MAVVLRRALACLCLALALLLLAYATWQYRPQTIYVLGTQGMGATLLAALALGLGRLLRGKKDAEGSTPTAPLAHQPAEAPPRWRTLALGVAALCWLVVVNIGPEGAGMSFRPLLPNSLQIGLWLSGIGLGLWALLGRWRWQPAGWIICA